MTLTLFIQDLVSEGRVTIAGKLGHFPDEDLVSASNILKEYYQRDILEVPGKAPVYDEAAALWGAGYLYYAIQFTMLREIGAEQLAEWFLPFAGTPTASAAYSADLSLRYLPGLMTLVKGLAPGDPLIDTIKETARLWPLSSVGMELEYPDPLPPGPVKSLEIILADDCLNRLYRDRIIQHKDRRLLDVTVSKESIYSALGAYASVIWPELVEV